MERLHLQFFADEVEAAPAETTEAATETTANAEVENQTETTEDVTPKATEAAETKAEKMFSEQEVNKVIQKRLAREKGASDFLEKLAKRQNLSVDAFMKQVDEAVRNEEISKYSTENNVSEEVAKKVLDLEQEVQGLKADKAKAEKEVALKQEWDDLIKEFPDVKPDSIPQEVLDIAKDGTKLRDAYTRYEYSKLKANQEDVKKNAIKDYLAGKLKIEPVEGSGGSAVVTPNGTPKTWQDAKKGALAMLRASKEFKV